MVDLTKKWIVVKIRNQVKMMVTIAVFERLTMQGRRDSRTRYLIHPIELAADVVTHSTTKWIGGHGTIIAGVIIDTGKFDWTSSRLLLLTSPAEGYCVLKFYNTFGSIAFAIKIRAGILRDLGAAQDCLTAFLSLLQALPTLLSHAERHCDNALAVAKFLEGHEKVKQRISVSPISSHTCFWEMLPVHHRD